uniref:HMA domain-containing protein n=1 Tax=Fagus sylvatica TaxID=28930 RepID=A0A2N9ITR5_FAGSY
MEYSSAEVSCVLKVNSQCETCKRKVMDVLQNVHGVYNISIDAEQGTVKVTGRVNPTMLLRVLERYGRHAEVKWIRFDGEVRERGYYYYGENGYVPSPYAPAPYGVSYHYPMMGGYEYPPYAGLEYPWYDSCRHLPPAPPPPMYPPGPPPMYPPGPPPMYQPPPPPPIRPFAPQRMPRYDIGGNYESCRMM